MKVGYVATYLSMIHRSAEVAKWYLRNHASAIFQSMLAPEGEEPNLDGRATIIGGSRQRPACLPIRRSYGPVSICGRE
jgi:hypothetical protein